MTSLAPLASSPVPSPVPPPVPPVPPEPLPPFDQALWKPRWRVVRHIFDYQARLQANLCCLDPGAPPADLTKELEDVVAQCKALHKEDENSERRRAVRDQGYAKTMENLLVFHGVGASWRDRSVLEREMPVLWEIMDTLTRVEARAALFHYKAKYMQPRPYELEPELRPLVNDILKDPDNPDAPFEKGANPGHPAYPSGHTHQRYLAALVLDHIVHPVARDPEARRKMYELAQEIGENRERAGVHYRSDTEAGRRLAVAVLPHFLAAFAEPIAEARQEFAAWWAKHGPNRTSVLSLTAHDAVATSPPLGPLASNPAASSGL